MKHFLRFAAVVATCACVSGGMIDVSTGTAPWQVFVPGSGSISVVPVSPNGTWAPAPAGSSWVSFDLFQSTSCVVGQTPGNGCANTIINPDGDLWSYFLTISAADLAATSGSLNFVFGSDNRVNLFVGDTSSAQVWNGGNPTNGAGFNPLGCSALPAPTDAGSTQASYSNCTTTVSFGATNLNPDGSLTLIAYNFNDPIPGCPDCGDPTGFILQGDLLTSTALAPEPSTFSLIGLVGFFWLLLYWMRVGNVKLRRFHFRNSRTAGSNAGIM